MAEKTNDYSVSRNRMIREQLLPRGINDEKVLQVMAQVPRHIFVEDALQNQAYGDYPLPIGEGQTISQPYIVALMTQALGLKGHETVLEIGTGCGYQTAVLAALCERVYSVERFKTLAIKTRRNLDRLGCLNVVIKIDDGTAGWDKYAPYDAIIITAASPEIPPPLLEQLRDPGTMVIPVGDRFSQELVVVRKKEGQISRETIEQVRFVGLIGQYGWRDNPL
ncbi:MAG: protein-L-isoaspartate(D-aspartate) O-methyltransferase [Thermodesulfobacteriota bacterium]